MLLQGLRDDDWKVREQCAKGLTGKLSASQVNEALPALEFKAHYDPVSQVRIAAIKAIGAAGSGGAEDTLAKLYQGSGNSLGKPGGRAQRADRGIPRPGQSTRPKP